MKKHYYLLMLLCLVSFIPPAYATEEDFTYESLRAELDEAFRNVDLNEVPTGLLTDYSITLIYPNDFNGILSDTNYVNFDVWKIVYTGLFRAQVNDRAHLEDPAVVSTAIEQDKAVGIMLYEYNEISPLSFIKKDDDHIILNPSYTFSLQTCFAVAPPSDTITTLLFKKEHLYTNINSDVSSIEVSFDDGTTYIPAEWNVPINPLKYTQQGEKDIAFRFTLSDGRTMESHSPVFIKDPNFRPQHVEPFSKAIKKVTIPASFAHAGGSLEILYFNNELTNGKFVRPLVIVSDLDYTALLGKPSMGLSSMNNFPEIKNAIEQLSKLYDIIYVNFNDSFDDLLRNGEYFANVIEYINANRFATYSDDTYIVGLGAGGVISRIGINKMEAQNKPHRIHKTIAVNAPFRGVNIPIGIQAAIRQANGIKDFIGSADTQIAKKISDLTSFLDSPAMKQLLIYRLDPNLIIQTDLNKLFTGSDSPTIKKPTHCESVAITVGGDSYRNLFTPYTKLFHANLNYWLIKKKIFRANIRYDAESYTLPNKSEALLYTGRLYFRHKIAFFKNNYTEISNYNIYSTPDMFPLDGTSGCYIPTIKFPQHEIISYGEFFVDNVCYTPIFSALNISSDSYFNDKIQNINIPFDRFYKTDNNKSIYDFSEFVTPLFSELTPIIVAENNKDILGDTQIKVDNVPTIPLISYIWNIKNNKFKIVSKNGNNATIRPTEYNYTRDSISATLSFLGQSFSYTTPPYPLHTTLIEIVGNKNISYENTPYELNQIPTNTSSINWKCSSGISLTNLNDTLVLAKAEKIEKEQWIEAEITVANSDKYIIRKELHSAPLESLRMEVVQQWWDPEELVDKYVLRVHHEPGNIPMEDLDFCWSAKVRILGRDNSSGTITTPEMLGNQCIETPGSVGMCDKYVIIIPPSATPTNNSTNPPTGYDPFIPIPALTGPNMALITLPRISYTEEVVGTVYCTVSDLFDNSQKISVDVHSKWERTHSYAATPNPANDKIVIRPESDASNNMERSAAMPKAVRAELYSDQILVKTVSFEEAATMCEINVADLANGNYYLLIYENDVVVDRQIVVIKH